MSLQIPLPQSHQIPVRRPHNPVVPFQPHSSWAKIEDHHRLRDTAKHWDAFDTTKLSQTDTRYHELEDRGRQLKQVDLSEYQYRNNGITWPPHPLIKKSSEQKDLQVSQEGEATNACGEKLRPIRGDGCDLCTELSQTRMMRAGQASLEQAHSLALHSHAPQHPADVDQHPADVAGSRQQ